MPSVTFAPRLSPKLLDAIVRLDDRRLPIAEVTFRTAVAADAIRLIAAETDVLVGAGTVVRPEQAALCGPR